MNPESFHIFFGNLPRSWRGKSRGRHRQMSDVFAGGSGISLHICRSKGKEGSVIAKRISILFRQNGHIFSIEKQRGKSPEL